MIVHNVNDKPIWQFQIVRTFSGRSEWLPKLEYTNFSGPNSSIPGLINNTAARFLFWSSPDSHPEVDIDITAVSRPQRKLVRYKYHSSVALIAQIARFYNISTLTSLFGEEKKQCFGKKQMKRIMYWCYKTNTNIIFQDVIYSMLTRGQHPQFYWAINKISTGKGTTTGDNMNCTVHMLHRFFIACTGKYYISNEYVFNSLWLLNNLQRVIWRR